MGALSHVTGLTTPEVEVHPHMRATLMLGESDLKFFSPTWPYTGDWKLEILQDLSQFKGMASPAVGSEPKSQFLAWLSESFSAPERPLKMGQDIGPPQLPLSIPTPVLLEKLSEVIGDFLVSRI